jgi:hypothetical protein
MKWNGTVQKPAQQSVHCYVGQKVRETLNFGGGRVQEVEVTVWQRTALSDDLADNNEKFLSGELLPATTPDEMREYLQEWDSVRARSPAISNFYQEFPCGRVYDAVEEKYVSDIRFVTSEVVGFLDLLLVDDTEEVSTGQLKQVPCFLVPLSELSGEGSGSNKYRADMAEFDCQIRPLFHSTVRVRKSRRDRHATQTISVAESERLMTRSWLGQKLGVGWYDPKYAKRVRSLQSRKVREQVSMVTPLVNKHHLDCLRSDLRSYSDSLFKRREDHSRETCSDIAGGIMHYLTIFDTTYGKYSHLHNVSVLDFIEKVEGNPKSYERLGWLVGEGYCAGGFLEWYDLVRHHPTVQWYLAKVRGSSGNRLQKLRSGAATGSKLLKPFSSRLLDVSDYAGEESRQEDEERFLRSNVTLATNWCHRDDGDENADTQEEAAAQKEVSCQVCGPDSLLALKKKRFKHYWLSASSDDSEEQSVAGVSDTTG